MKKVTARIPPLSENRAKEILEKAKNNPPVKVCRTSKELHDYMQSLLKSNFYETE